MSRLAKSYQFDGVVGLGVRVQRRRAGLDKGNHVFYRCDPQIRRLDHGAESPILSEHRQLDRAVEARSACTEGMTSVRLPFELERRVGHQLTGMQRLAVYAQRGMRPTERCR